VIYTRTNSISVLAARNVLSNAHVIL